MIFAFLLLAIGAFFSELGSSIGKHEVEDQKESIYTMGFLDNFFGVLIFAGTAIFIKNSFYFSLASLPIFSLRAFLEIAQAYATALAISRADRSTYSFIKIGTVPLLLAADVALGYTITFYQMAGIGIIIFALALPFANRGIRNNGLGWVLFATANAAITLSLFKYDIAHFNSVVAEQGIIMMILIVFFFLMAKFRTKENPLVFLRNRIFFTQSFSNGASSVITSFAYNFAPASIITTAFRSLSVFAAMLSGNFYFKEKHFLIKFVSLLFIVVGLVLLVV